MIRIFIYRDYLRDLVEGSNLYINLLSSHVGNSHGHFIILQQRRRRRLKEARQRRINQAEAKRLARERAKRRAEESSETDVERTNRLCQLWSDSLLDELIQGLLTRQQKLVSSIHL
ncbi:unnamed protein product [Protopolystoma xenopodis]|uniref:Uncharacterized protein n=1 Tax=Protopolystoma xenopodis TaxID=117903 RepID=A0A3S5AZJ7_9PLAT|nr:unnamed protein product [Protopolystoma xenopodis]